MYKRKSFPNLFHVFFFLGQSPPLCRMFFTFHMWKIPNLVRKGISHFFIRFLKFHVLCFRAFICLVLLLLVDTGSHPYFFFIYKVFLLNFEKLFTSSKKHFFHLFLGLSPTSQGQNRQNLVRILFNVPYVAITHGGISIIP